MAREKSPSTRSSTFAKSFALAVLALAGLTPPISAQPIFELDYGLPRMALHVCYTFEAAGKQAKLSEQAGRLPFDSERLTLAKDHHCRHLLVTLTPKQPVTAIAPYMSWQFSYAPGSGSTFEAMESGKRYTVPYRPTLQRTLFYVAEVLDQNDNRYLAWVAIPDRPYLSDYFKNE